MKQITLVSQFFLLVFITCLVFPLSSCSSGTSTTSTSTSTATVTSTPGTTTTTPGNATASQIADQGKTVFTNNCTMCHGTNGQGITGPALIGQYTSIDKYVTGKGLLDFIDTTMPLNAPASLSSEQYFQLVVFLLLQNNWINGSSAIGPNDLGSISLPQVTG